MGRGEHRGGAEAGQVTTRSAGSLSYNRRSYLYTTVMYISYVQVYHKPLTKSRDQSRSISISAEFVSPTGGTHLGYLISRDNLLG